MTFAIHKFSSVVADIGDTSIVQPSDWNASHTVSANWTMGYYMNALVTGTNASTWYTGPSADIIGSGTWLLMGQMTVQLIGSAAMGTYLTWRLGDGTNVYCGAEQCGASGYGTSAHQKYVLPLQDIFYMTASGTKVKMEWACTRASSVMWSYPAYNNSGLTSKISYVKAFKLD